MWFRFISLSPSHLIMHAYLYCGPVVMCAHVPDISKSNVCPNQGRILATPFWGPRTFDVVRKCENCIAHGFNRVRRGRWLRKKWLQQQRVCHHRPLLWPDKYSIWTKVVYYISRPPTCLLHFFLSWPRNFRIYIKANFSKK